MIEKMYLILEEVVFTKVLQHLVCLELVIIHMQKYKVGISGFYKRPLFALLYNENKIEHPIMVDDTSYFLSFDNYSDAYTCMLLLNSSRVQKFLLSISFQDAKRPYTKKVLQRLDFNKCVHNIAFGELVATEKELKLHKSITEEMYASFANYITGLKKAI